MQNALFWYVCLVATSVLLTGTAENITVWPLSEWTPPSLDLDLVPQFLPEDYCPKYTCSDYTTREYCKCDEYCRFYGDCCWGADGFNTSDEFPERYPSRENLRCQYIPGYSSSLFRYDHQLGYNVIGDCPRSTDQVLYNLCTSKPSDSEYVKAETIIPAVDKNGFVYRNIYCARCNGVKESDILMAEVNQYCDRCNGFRVLTLLPEHKIRLLEPDCALSTNFPNGSRLRDCSDVLIQECSESFKWTKEREMCKRYISPVFHENVFFKNSHCAICNEAHQYICINLEMTIRIYTHLDNATWDIGLSGQSSYVQKPSPEKFNKLPDKVDQKEIHFLQCPSDSPTDTFVELEIANNTHCPYYVKRIENCLLERMQIASATIPGVHFNLPWKVLNNSSTHDNPFFLVERVNLHIPEIVTKTHGIEYLTSYISHLLQQCSSTKIKVIHVCKNLSEDMSIMNCQNRYKFNTTKIIARGNVQEQLQILYPETSEYLSDISWFAFVYQVSNDDYTNFRYTTATGIEICTDSPHLQTTPSTVTTLFEYRSQGTRYSPVEVIFSSICVAISILCLTITLLTYCVFPELRNSFGITLMNFTGTLAIAQLLSHFVTDYVTSWNAVCHIAAFATHFFWLASFAWMNLLAWNLKSTFGKPTIQTGRGFTRRQSILYLSYGWVLPLIIVSVCGVLYYVPLDIPIKYGPVLQGQNCWIGNNWVVLSVVGGPLIAVIIINGVLFALTMRGIRKSRFIPNSTSQVNGRSKTIELLIYIKISILMGFTWLVVFLVQYDPSRTLIYITSIAFGLQGFLIMVFFALNQRVRSLWKKKLCSSNEIRSKQTTNQTKQDTGNVQSTSA
ncbi:hypothetical protein BSL78_04119 [Apostichopus japonicus]|uniref:G-protein coupled receptors family 2 profile 2 domain-containing protein n=1 Tax=Stichopus japonicus TaxID=307972 RepID=A0A2G8LFC5_STIJA|nr:hypothetical protein BSL78_04119 [Apostichopus japonicus]